MTTTTKILLAFIGALLIVCVVLRAMLSSRDRIIMEQARSIEAGAKVARHNEQTAAALRLMVHELEQRGRADAEELARLKEQLSEPTPIPQRPRTSEGMRRRIMEGVKAR